MRILILSLSITLLFISCKKSDTPKPDNTTPTDTTKTHNGGGNNNPTDTNSTPTNHAPVFNSTSVTLYHNSTTNILNKTFSLPVSDGDGDNITISSITGNSSNVSISYSGLGITITPNNSLYGGIENLSITISDGTATTTSNFTVSIGTSNYITTYTNLNSYLGRPLSFITGDTYAQFDGTLTISSNGNITATQAQPNGEFFASTMSSGTYKINDSGYLIVTAGGYNISYQISIDNSISPYMIVFTKQNYWNSGCNCGAMYSFQ